MTEELVAGSASDAVKAAGQACLDARNDADASKTTAKAFVEALADSRPLLGADVCGEIPACKGGTERDFLHNASTNIRLNRLLLSKIRLSL